jgi:hypothetical protein
MLDMSDSATKDLEKIGLEAARELGGEGAVQNVEVAPGLDSLDRPVYWFTYLLDEARLRLGLGRFYVRLIQALQEALIARGDEHFPMIRLLNSTDWEKHRNA